MTTGNGTQGQTDRERHGLIVARVRRLRWTAFGLVVIAYVLSFFHRMAPATIAADLQQVFQASGVALGSLAASYFYVYTLMQIPTGVLVDTLGVRSIVALGGLIAGIGSVLFALAESFGLAAFGRLLVGFGVSVMFISMMKINAAWFHDRHFATAVGLTVLLGNLGAVLAAAPLVWILQWASWREVFVAVGVLSLILGVLSYVLVRNSPADAGLPTMREMEGKSPHASRKGHWLEGLRAVVKNRDTWPGFWPAFGIGGTLFTFAGLWAVPYLRDVHQLTRAEAAQHTSVTLIGFAIGSLLVGALSDRLGRRRPVMISASLAYVLCWLPLLIGAPMPRPASLALFAVMGVLTAGFTLVWAAAKEVNPPALAGMATSVVNTGAFLGAAVLQPLVGWVMDLTWAGRLEQGVRIYSLGDYRLGLGMLMIAAIIGLIGALRVRETYCRYVVS